MRRASNFYTNNTIPYFRAPHHYMGLAARFMEGRQVLNAGQAESIGLKSSHGHTYMDDCSDAVLLTSRAGSNRYDRTFMEAFIIGLVCGLLELGIAH